MVVRGAERKKERKKEESTGLTDADMNLSH
jgi:hypothetical protein